MKLLFAILVAVAFGAPAVAQPGCGTYARIRRAIHRAAEIIREEG